jgi:hypothetical protein
MRARPNRSAEARSQRLPNFDTESDLERLRSGVGPAVALRHSHRRRIENAAGPVFSELRRRSDFGCEKGAGRNFSHRHDGSDDRPLQHSQLDNAIFNLAPFEARPSRKLEGGSVLLQIAEGLTLRLACRFQKAHLPG